MHMSHLRLLIKVKNRLRVSSGGSSHKSFMDRVSHRNNSLVLGGMCLVPLARIFLHHTELQKSGVSCS